MQDPFIKLSVTKKLLKTVYAQNKCEEKIE